MYFGIIGKYIHVYFEPVGKLERLPAEDSVVQLSPHDVPFKES